MKHAILVLGYRNFDYVIEMINRLDEDFYVFIHWDKRFQLNDNQILWLSTQNRIVFGLEYECNWGSYGIVKGEMWLCELALKNKEIEYFHLISDMDIMIPPINKFKLFFKEHRGSSFMKYHKVDMYGLGCVPRDNLAYYHRLEKYNYHVNEDDDKAYYAELLEQIKANKVRELPTIPLYTGGLWWSLYRDSIEYLVSQKEFIHKYFIDTRVPDEMFVLTVIMNGPTASKVENMNLRTILWIYKNGNSPAIFDETDYDLIITKYNNDNCVFARKIHPDISRKLINMIYDFQQSKDCSIISSS